MNERVFRLILGSVLLLLLYLQQEQFMYAYIGVLLFEGLTNWRVPKIVSRLRFGPEWHSRFVDKECAKIPFDAERMLRLIVALMLVVSYVLYQEQLWFFPWFIGFMLLMAGVTNICPMVMSLRWLGFR